MRPDGADAYRRDIDGLRCLAVVSVLLAHAEIPYAAGGFVGVDVFFVISGYLITGIITRALRDGGNSIVDFYERRARRILPALFVVMLATLAVAAAALSPGQFESLAGSAVAATLFASNIYFRQTGAGYFGADLHNAPLLHTWSLGVEEQFYIVVPFLLWLAHRRAPRLLAPLVGLVVALSFAWACYLLLRRDAASAFFLLPPRAWELGIGSLLALAPPPLPRGRTPRATIALLALAAILVPVMVYSEATPFPGPAALPPVLGAAGLIWVNREGGNPVRRLLSTRLFVGVGLISYSLYLWHWPVIVFPRVYLGALTPALSAVCLALSLVLATLSWRFVERPFRGRGALLPGRGALFGASAAAMGVMAAAGLAVVASAGFPGRLDATATAAFAAAEDLDPRSELCMKFNSDPFSPTCRIGAAGEGRADFLLWGDSHAAAALPGIDLAARKAGRTGYAATRPACAPLLDTLRIDQPMSERCARFGRSVIEALRGRDDIPLVILDARWQLATEGTDIGANRSQPSQPALLRDLTGALPSGDVSRNYAIFEAAFARTVDAITATGRKVVVLGAVPEVGWLVPDRVGYGLMHHLPPPAAPAPEQVAARMARSDELFRTYAAAGRIDYLPLFAAFCAESCAVVNAASTPLYRDDDHLSRTGSIERVGPVVLAAIRGAGQATARAEP
ncbi:acyltransferase family protein [Amaricoccus solimangrovi]|nr:acyltransferase family protein [Amaricoccus solimangrovi]